MTALLAKLLSSVAGAWGLKLVDAFLSHREKMATTEVERDRVAVDRARVDADVVMNDAGHRAATIQRAMDFKAFWVPWLIATVPLAAWFGWGCLDSLANGALPDVAALPPQLYDFARSVWASLFYSAGGVGVAQMAATAVRDAAKRGAK